MSLTLTRFLCYCHKRHHFLKKGYIITLVGNLQMGAEVSRNREQGYTPAEGAKEVRGQSRCDCWQPQVHLQLRGHLFLQA